MASAFENLAPRFIHDFCKALGTTPAQAAGVAGNINEESGFRAIQELRPISGRGGFGWVQWTGPRRVAFENYCSTHGLDPTSYEANLGFLIHELTTSHAGSLKHLKMTTTPKAAAETFGYHFERFLGYQNLSSSNYARRVASANKAYALWAASPYAKEATPVPAPIPAPVQPPVAIPDPVPVVRKKTFWAAGITSFLVALLAAKGIPVPEAWQGYIEFAIAFLGQIAVGWFLSKSTAPTAGSPLAQATEAAKQQLLQPSPLQQSIYSMEPVHESWNQTLAQNIPDLTPGRLGVDDVFRIILQLPLPEAAALAEKVLPVLTASHKAAVETLEKTPPSPPQGGQRSITDLLNSMPK